MFKQIALVTFDQGASAAARAEVRNSLAGFAGARRCEVSGALPLSRGGGDLVWHLHFDGEADWKASGATAAVEAVRTHRAVAEVDAQGYEPQIVRINRPNIRDAVYRTLFVSVKESARNDQVHAWWTELRAMPE